MQTACTARHLRPFLFAILAMTILASSGGCADFGRHPSWSPFYKNADEDVVGVVSPAERMASLRKLAETAARADAVTKQRAAAEVTHAFQTEADRLWNLVRPWVDVDRNHVGDRQPKIRNIRLSRG